MELSRPVRLCNIIVISPLPWIFKVRFRKFCIPGIEGSIHMERKGCESIGCNAQFVTFNFDLNHDLGLGFSRSDFEKVVSHEWDGRLTWNERNVDKMVVNFDLTHHDLDLGISRADSLGMKGFWVGYDVGCTMGLTLGHSAWQIDWPSNGSMWNSYSFQPVGPWMGYSFTDLRAEGCCRSLNASLNIVNVVNFLQNSDKHAIGGLFGWDGGGYLKKAYELAIFTSQQVTHLSVFG